MAILIDTVFTISTLSSKALNDISFAVVFIISASGLETMLSSDSSYISICDNGLPDIDLCLVAYPTLHRLIFSSHCVVVCQLSVFDFTFLSLSLTVLSIDTVSHQVTQQSAGHTRQ